jgi:AcrR family transcriptional regulator
MTPSVTVNKSGQALGRKGQRTRAKLVTAARLLVRETQLGSLTVAAIAKQSGIAAPTFYLYFQDVGEVLLGVIEEVNQEMEGVLELLKEPWEAQHAHARASEFVEAYFELWIRYGPELRARNHLADQGDPRFFANRRDAGAKFFRALARKFQEIPGEDATETITPISMAAVISIALERLATIIAFAYYEKSAVSWSDSGRVLAYLIANAAFPQPLAHTPR